MDICIQSPYTTHSPVYALEEYKEWLDATKWRAAQIYKDNLHLSPRELEASAALLY
jgi:hypothetical protein